MMCGKKEDQGECSQSHHHQQVQNIQEQLLLQQQQQMMQQQQQNHNDLYGRGLIFPHDQAPPPILQPWTLPPIHGFNPAHFPVRGDNNIDPFLVPPPAPSSSYASFFNRRGAPSLQFTYDGSASDHHHLRILSEALGPMVQPGSAPFGLQAELGKLTAQEIMDAKALAASKSHSEAERRRRERINNHLAKLRSLLPSTTKTDKASLLAEVIQHVKELKRQTSVIAETSPVPTETDELIVDDASDEEGKFVIKASLCCEDRSDLLPDLIKTLKALRLRTLKAEITTLGGRVKNVLFITGEEDSSSSEEQQQQQYCISSIQEALKAVMEKSGGGDDSNSSGSVKRQRTTNNTNINIL
ncbi:transcription factor bHLH30 [Rosa rugosa]|uniref:transcription factor bHLH30 n=1 Tax=Rosa rugosa TaxID=74645 RepID=UPI002B403C7E|nr:transcription factor bHLH30 [Rosa rugosa]XP_061990999.1 transcription factor bHLH30 [Rosa rugosa]